MSFGSRNVYYLRISADIALPLFLYLDERHVDWMSDVVLQHVLADLRPLVIPKLQAEKDVHFGPGGAPGSRRGTVAVHRGETYQFAYFFRKTEPHTVLFKSRHFVTAPLGPKVVPGSASLRPATQNPLKKRSGAYMPTKQSRCKRARTKGKDSFSQSYLNDNEWYAEEDTDPRPVWASDNDIDQEDGDGEVTMHPAPGADNISSSDSAGHAFPREIDDTSRVSPDTVDIDLTVEEEETKPKPLLKLKYQSFPISGHCLCVVVEPWPLLRVESRLQPTGLSLVSSDVSVVSGERAKTPLFFPEYDRAPSEAPFTRGATLPPIPLFHNAIPPRAENDDGEENLMQFSQTLNAAGHMHAITADDDDDMDGAVLFGDADEIRELF